MNDQKSKLTASPQPLLSAAGEPHEYGEKCGGEGGVPYLTILQPTARLKKITIWHRDYVDGIQLETDLGPLPRIGGTGKHHDVHEDSFELDSKEVLTGLTVEFWQYIDRITFHTNERSFGPYGGSRGLLKRTMTVPSGHSIVGFKGRHWELVDSIQLMIL